LVFEEVIRKKQESIERLKNHLILITQLIKVQNRNNIFINYFEYAYYYKSTNDIFGERRTLSILTGLSMNLFSYHIQMLME